MHEFSRIEICNLLRYSRADNHELLDQNDKLQERLRDISDMATEIV